MDINYGIGDEVFKRDTCKMWPLLIKKHDPFLYVYTYTFIKIIITTYDLGIKQMKVTLRG